MKKTFLIDIVEKDSYYLEDYKIIQKNKYVGVSYYFKIFLMLEAQKLGFDNVL